jgi:hypothetical protein
MPAQPAKMPTRIAQYHFRLDHQPSIAQIVASPSSTTALCDITITDR